MVLIDFCLNIWKKDKEKNKAKQKKEGIGWLNINVIRLSLALP